MTTLSPTAQEGTMTHQMQNCALGPQEGAWEPSQSCSKTSPSELLRKAPVCPVIEHQLWIEVIPKALKNCEFLVYDRHVNAWKKEIATCPSRSDSSPRQKGHTYEL